MVSATPRYTGGEAAVNGTRLYYEYRPPPVRTPHTSLADQTAGCIVVSVPNAGSACTTAGRSQPPQSRLCFAPVRKPASCGPPMSAACTVRTMEARVGASWSGMSGRRSTCGASRWYGNPHFAVGFCRSKVTSSSWHVRPSSRVYRNRSIHPARSHPTCLTARSSSEIQRVYRCLHRQ
jgi:hypothetical protein